MFEVSNARNNMYIIVACIALLALSSNLICYAQNQILNVAHLKSLSPDSLSPHTTSLDADNQSFCWDRPTGCTEEELAQIGLSECAEFRLSPSSDHIICVPSETSSATTTTSTPKTPSSQKEELEPDVVTSVSDLKETIDSLVRSIEAKERQIERLETGQQNTVNSNYDLQAKFSNINPALDDLTDVKQQETSENNEDEIQKRCKDSGDFYSNCGANSIDSGATIIKQPMLEPSPSSFPGSGDKKGSFGHLKDRVATRAWRYGLQQDHYRYSKKRDKPQPEVDSPNHQNQLTMTADEARRMVEARRQEFLLMRDAPESTSSKVPIIMLKFGAIRNQRRSSTKLAQRGHLLSPSIRMVTYPTIRLHRSNLNNSTIDHLRHLKLVQKINLDGASMVANGTMFETGSGLQQQQQQQQLAVDESGRLMAAKDSYPLECTMRRYTFKAVKSDASGERCSGLVSATICYGACETGEIADWLFPHKKPMSRVCSHGMRVRRKVMLNECSSNNVDNQLREYHFVDAKSCVCQKCTSHDTNCLGSLTRPYLGSLDDTSPGEVDTGTITRVID